MSIIRDPRSAIRDPRSAIRDPKQFDTILNDLLHLNSPSFSHQNASIDGALYKNSPYLFTACLDSDTVTSAGLTTLLSSSSDHFIQHPITCADHPSSAVTGHATDAIAAELAPIFSSHSINITTTDSLNTAWLRRVAPVEQYIAQSTGTHSLPVTDSALI